MHKEEDSLQRRMSQPLLEQPLHRHNSSPTWSSRPSSSCTPTHHYADDDSAVTRTPTSVATTLWSKLGAETSSFLSFQHISYLSPYDTLSSLTSSTAEDDDDEVEGQQQQQQQQQQPICWPTPLHVGSTFEDATYSGAEESLVEDAGSPASPSWGSSRFLSTTHVYMDDGQQQQQQRQARSARTHPPFVNLVDASCEGPRTVAEELLGASLAACAEEEEEEEEECADATHTNRTTTNNNNNSSTNTHFCVSFMSLTEVDGLLHSMESESVSYTTLGHLPTHDDVVGACIRADEHRMMGDAAHEMSNNAFIPLRRSSAFQKLREERGTWAFAPFELSQHQPPSSSSISTTTTTTTTTKTTTATSPSLEAFRGCNNNTSEAVSCADGDHDVDPRHIPRPLRQRSSYSLISWPTTENTTTTNNNNNNKMARRNNSRVFDVQLPVQSSSMSLQSMELHNADDSAEWA